MKKAFTLIEVVVVIAIISILLAILYPVFNAARNRHYYNQVPAPVYYDEVPVFVHNEVYVVNGVSRTRPVYRLNSTGKTVYSNKPVPSTMAAPKYTGGFSGSTTTKSGSFGSGSGGFSAAPPRSNSFGGRSSGFSGSYRPSTSSSGSFGGSSSGFRSSPSSSSGSFRSGGGSVSSGRR